MMIVNEKVTQWREVSMEALKHCAKLRCNQNWSDDGYLRTYQTNDKRNFF